MVLVIALAIALQASGSDAAQLAEAAQDGRASAVQSLISKGAKIDDPDATATIRSRLCSESCDMPVSGWVGEVKFGCQT